MLTLKPVKTEFKISTTDLILVYTESGGTKIEVGAIPVIPNNEEKCVNIAISFTIVAEAKCVTINFYECFYNDFCISEEPSEEYRLSYSGFYEVIDSRYLQENRKLYDPKDRLHLKHFIITGYDSYIEVIAAAYTIERV